MAEATDVQMQQYANERIRPRAEQVRAIIASLQDDKAAIDDIYARANNGANPWSDNRTDGPPTLLDQQDVLSYNAFADLLLKCFAGTATAQDVADMAANYNTVKAACVRPLGA